MKKGQIYTGYVEKVNFPNKAKVRIEEETEGGEHKVSYCTVKNLLPGQTVEVMVTKLRNGKGEGYPVRVCREAPNQIPSRCPHFPDCGGCTYQHLSYEDQAKLKEKQVRELLEPVLKNQEQPYEFFPIKFSPVQKEYRNKMEFTFGDTCKDGPLALGLHKRGGFYDIISVTDCRICDEDCRKILAETLHYFEKLPYRRYHRVQHTGFLRHLVVRKAVRTGEILVSIVTTTQDSCDFKPWADKILSLPLQGKIAGILHIENDSVSDTVQSDATHILYGQDYITEKILGLSFRISQFSFFQTNTLGAELLYQTARDFIGDLGSGDKIVYDLYSGTGTIAQMMAPVCKKVIGIEIVEEAVEAARENALQNGLTNCEFIAGDVLKKLDEVEEKPDFIILDPPRDGIHPKALKKIIDYGVDRLLYISCKPTSLQRDLEVFLESGYHVEKVVPVDQFPYTANVETVVSLSRSSSENDSSI